MSKRGRIIVRRAGRSEEKGGQWYGRCKSFRIPALLGALELFGDLWHVSVPVWVLVKPLSEEVGAPPSDRRPAAPHRACRRPGPALSAPMAPKSKDKGGKSSAADRAKALQEKGRGLAQKAAYLTLSSVLKERPDLVREFTDRLKDEQILTLTGDLNPEYRAPEFGAAKKEPDDGSEPSKDALNEDDETLAAIVLHRNYNSWGSVPPKYMKWLLGQAEPISMSKFALKAVTVPGAKEPPREAMLELLEAMTDISRDQPLGDDRSLAALSSFVCRRNVQNGRRLSEMRLPCDFDGADGFYDHTFEASAKKLVLRHRATGKEVTLELLGIKDGTFPKVTLNFSVARAMIVYTLDDGSEESEQIQQFFLKSGVDMASTATGLSPAKPIGAVKRLQSSDFHTRTASGPSSTRR